MSYFSSIKIVLPTNPHSQMGFDDLPAPIGLEIANINRNRSVNGRPSQLDKNPESSQATATETRAEEVAVNRDERLVALFQAFDKCSPLFRDTMLSNDILERYKIGLFLREPTFCDATFKLSGFVAPHRFLIISSNARCLDQIVHTTWGLCVWQTGRVFKVIDQTERSGRLQITLLEIPEEFLDLFCNTDPGRAIEESFISQAHSTFDQCIELPPLPELNTDEWRNRLVFPIGINDEGHYFPIFGSEATQNENSVPLVREVLLHQAQVHLWTSDYDEAALLLKQALGMRTTSDSEVHGRIFLTLADLQFAIGDLTSAEDSLLKAFATFKDIPHEMNRLAVAATHVRLAHVYQSGGAFAEAEQNYRHALNIRRGTGTRESIIPLLTGLGALYEQMGKYEDAQSALNEALEVQSAGTAECHDPTLLNNLGRVAQAKGEHTKAIELFRRALTVHQKSSALDLQTRAKLLYNVAEAQCAAGTQDEALRTFEDALQIDRRLIREVTSVASERRRQEYLTASQFRVHQCISLVLRYLPQSDQALELATKLIFERKSLGLDLHVLRRRTAFSGNSEVVKNLDEISSIEAQLQLEWLDANAQSYKTGRPEAGGAQELLESETLPSGLSDDVKRRLESGDWREISKRLPENSVLVEFLRLNFFNFEAVRARGEHPQLARNYIAVILSDSCARPRLVDFGDAHRIDRLIDQLRLHITGMKDSNAPPSSLGEDVNVGSLPEVLRGSRIAQCSKELRRLVVDQLRSSLPEGARVFISPDGDLCRLPLEILQFDGGDMVIDRYEVSYLTSGNDLLRLSAPRRGERGISLVVADPDFDACSKEGDSERLLGTPFERLAGTKAEGEAIAKMLGGVLACGSAAVESVVKKSRSPAVLHLATHGFVLPFESQYVSADQLEVGMTLTSDRPMIGVSAAGPNEHDARCDETYVVITPPRMLDAAATGGFTRLSGRGVTNPMLRSGIALSGANTWLRGGELSNNAEDGLLTAEEICDLDLAGTELVVVSACETGLGDIVSGEGVFGLRRSFVLAGARSLVISLWQVPDAETKDLMIEFYSRLLQGQARSKALRGAQLALRCQYPDPYFWGAFICQGDPEPITFS
jgi:CHAT domain-containing protein/tetratricopeptide (TPR) repeat protein